MSARARSSRPQALIPNFRGLRALVLHQPDRNRNAFVLQLERLGVMAEAAWPAWHVGSAKYDIVFFDSDMGFDDLFDWIPGQAPMPLVAILGSEAPGRIEWTLTQAPSAYLIKPVGSTGVFSVLAIAFHRFAIDAARIDAVRRMEKRLQMRGTVLAAVVALMRRHRIDEQAALAMLRAESMRHRLTLEAVSTLLLKDDWRGEPPGYGDTGGTTSAESVRKVRRG